MIRQRGRELVGNERSDQRSIGSSSAITVDHASHAGMKTLAVGSKLTKVGATPTLVSVAALQQTSDDKAPKIGEHRNCVSAERRNSVSSNIRNGHVGIKHRGKQG